MLKLTRDCEYALRAMVCLASRPDGSISLIREIAVDREIPRTYLSKIMRQLTKAGLVRSRRGTGGGLALARPSRAITLKDVIEAMEGPIRLNTCLTGRGECPRYRECPAHPVWVEAQKALIDVLEGKTLEKLSKDCAAAGMDCAGSGAKRVFFKR